MMSPELHINCRTRKLKKWPEQYFHIDVCNANPVKTGKISRELNES